MAASIDGQAAAEQAALIARVGRGDQAAFRELADVYVRPMHRLAWRMLLDTAEAEEVVQEGFVQLWTGAPRWREGDGRVGGWLYRVCTNLCLDRLRRSRRGQGSELDEGIAAPDAIDRARLGDTVVACLAALSDRQRAAIVLTYYEALPDASAADVLGMKLKAFESLLFRARAVLRSRLEARGIGANEAPASGGAR